MKRIYISEEEKSNILRQHKGYLLKEDPAITQPAATQPAATQPVTPATQPATAQATTQAVNYKIADIQNLLAKNGYPVGTADNQLGPNTLKQILAALTAIMGAQTQPVQATQPVQVQSTQGQQQMTQVQQPAAGVQQIEIPGGIGVVPGAIPNQILPNSPK